ncbi:hypothetical protein M9H77_11780 [Catharanthus roseus]|uniref:Uncharacterized protein n=1 Tax=Catharanthus roseus TaxID=4058 RepID=A0ACC0BFG8_CATRO|nr:hypothetical protein M9H77_11780 [Catharanthus roseus]
MSSIINEDDNNEDEEEAEWESDEEEKEEEFQSESDFETNLFVSLICNMVRWSKKRAHPAAALTPAASTSDEMSTTPVKTASTPASIPLGTSFSPTTASTPPRMSTSPVAASTLPATLTLFLQLPYSSPVPTSTPSSSSSVGMERCLPHHHHHVHRHPPLYYQHELWHLPLHQPLHLSLHQPLHLPVHPRVVLTSHHYLTHHSQKKYRWDQMHERDIWDAWQR